VASKQLKKIIAEDREYLFQNYGERLPVCFTRGENSHLYDQDNRKYIDFFSGIAVSNLGYSSKQLLKAITSQAGNIIHSSNWYLNREQINAAKQISGLAFPGKTLFVNSGTEANEAAIKLARRYGLSLSKKRYEIITFENSFHGRTMGSMTATGQEKIHTGYGPLPSGFKYLKFNDIKAFKKQVKKNGNIAAVMLELIQGEGGINIAHKEYVEELFSICNKNEIITIVDEVQTGIGRTGSVFCFQNYNIVPDIITLAKGIAGGLPAGVLHAKKYFSDFLSAGTHGSTFGGNHLASTAIEAVLQEVKKKSLLDNVRKTGEYIRDRLIEISSKVNFINEVRGMGLQIGIELNKPGMPLVRKALEHGLVINCTAENVLRIMPPLVITMNSVREGMAILEKLFIEEVSTDEDTKA
jgi:acetylornithine/N-succinyldiaminopimelate aminotransferase